MKLPLARIEEFVQGTGEFDGNLVAGGYSIDSRTVTPGQVFFAVAGERVDGHDFVEAALQAGAVAAVVRKDMLARYSVKTGLIAVDDTLAALQVFGRRSQEAVGKDRSWSHRLDRQDDHERCHRSRPVIAAQGIEIGRQPEQPFRTSAAIASPRA